MKVKKILYAAALSEDTHGSFCSAMEIAKTFDAKLFILHVVEELPPSTMAMLQWVDAEKITKKHYEEFRMDSVEKIRALIQKICDDAFKDDKTCKERVEGIKVVIGYPADEILKNIDEMECDALIMGTHSKGAVTHTFLGSVAERVLRRNRKPTFVIPSL
ncbi:MAG: universal stress protein [Deltaproteobacteria bacterium]|nr:universal stress protein [Deltaproteobacteria bacterium]